jgi:hypothetical protein
MIKAFLLISIFAISINSYCCECKDLVSLEEGRKQEFVSSDNVFIATVISFSSDYSYSEVSVEEVFKGNLKKTTKLIIYNPKGCEPLIHESEGKWLIYSSEYDNKLYLNACGLSRGFNEPDENLHFRLSPPPPPPPPLPSDSSKIEYIQKPIPQEIIEKNKVKAIRLLEEEIHLLRENKY